MSQTVDNYLLDLGALLRERALEAKAQASASVGTAEHQFELGRSIAYYEVLSLLTQQADAFGLPRAALSLEDFDPDADLLAHRAFG